MAEHEAWLEQFVLHAGASFGIGRDAELWVSGLGPPLPIAAFAGEEALNELYAFDAIVAANALAAPLLARAVGKDASLALLGERGGRTIHGVLARIDFLEPRADLSVFRVRLVPRMALLAETRDSRVFQTLTVPQIVEQVLTLRGIPHRFAVARARTEREYCLQYDESDLAFVFRLLAEEGLCSTFEHLTPSDAEQSKQARPVERFLVFDTPSAHRPIGNGPSTLLYRPEAATHDRAGFAVNDEVTRFAIHREIASGAVTHRDFDFSKAGPTPGMAHPSPTGSTDRPTLQNGAFTTARRVEARPENPALEVYDHRHREGAARTSVVEPGIHLAQLRRDTLTFEGASRCRRLEPGRTFVLLDYPAHDEDIKGPVCVTRLIHRGRAEGASGVFQYTNRFGGIPNSLVHLPKAPRRRFVQTLETATVVGPPEDLVHTEGFGRVRIQFHWDRLGKNDAFSSIWVRVAQAWSGASYGFQFVPRIGHEVLVGFLGGDPDHPVIVGSMPNLANPLPQLLPQDAARSAIRTSSIPLTGGYNEILFSDLAGQELLALRAQHNHDVVVLNDHRHDVSGSSINAVGVDRSTVVGQNEALEVRGASRKLVVGDEVHTVGGSRQEKVDGRSALQVGQDRLVHVGGFAEHTVEGDYRFVVGSAVAREATTLVHGIHHFAASNLLELESGKRVRITCGPTVIELTPEGLRIDAPKIEVNATGKTSIGAGTIDVIAKQKLHLQGTDVAAVAKAGATLTLDGNAWLDGKKVLLNCGGREPKPETDVKAGRKEPVTFRIAPPPGMVGPFTVRIATPTGEIVELLTNEANEVSLEGEPGDAFVLLEVRKGAVVLDRSEVEGS